MHPIEQKVNLFLEQVCEGNAAFNEELIEEFGERCKSILRKQFVEKKQEEKKFYLRMSNIGKTLRQLMLGKIYGGTYKSTNEWKLKATIGHLYEAFFIAVLKQSGVNIQDQDKQVVLDVANTKLYGTYDVKIDGKIYDIKTASPFAYEHKFASADSLRKGDSFGYYAQGFGYALADKTPFGGWIALNKSTGEFKVVSIPEYEQDELQYVYGKEIHDKVKHVTTSDVIPPCDGVIEEEFFKKKTGNKILNRDCEWCDCKTKCHPDVQALPDVNSKAAMPKIKWYIGKVIRPDAKAS